MTDRQSTKPDNLLDRALAEYVAAEPGAELERRVLDYARHRGVSSTTPWSRPLVRWLAVAAAIVVAISIFRLEHRSPQIMPASYSREVASIESAIPKPATQAVPRVVRVVVHRRRGHHLNRALPKRELFPTPSPLSSEERALVAYANHPTKEIPPELTELGAPIKPIQIDPIEIRPLDRITP